MYNILSDSKKFVKSSVVDDKYLKFTIEIEKNLTHLLKELKASEAISETDYKKLKPRGSSFHVLYGLCKTHKRVLDKSPPFRPILSAIKTPSYNLAKFLVPLIEPITKSNFTVKTVLNSLRKYVNKTLNTLWPALMLCPFSPIYHWRKLLKSVVTHFISINNCCVTSVKISLRNFFELHLVSNNYSLFDGTIYQQTDGVAMGSPLGYSLANAFLAHYEQIWLNDCLEEFKPVHYKTWMIYLLYLKRRLTDHYHFLMC